MGEKMTLDDARAVFKTTSEGLHSVANACSTNYRDAMQRRAVEFDKALAVVDAHLTQPAQAVDAWRIDFADGSHVAVFEEPPPAMYESVGAKITPLITAALPKDSNGAEGVWS